MHEHLVCVSCWIAGKQALKTRADGVVWLEMTDGFHEVTYIRSKVVEIRCLAFWTFTGHVDQDLHQGCLFLEGGGTNLSRDK